LAAFSARCPQFSALSRKISDCFIVSFPVGRIGKPQMRDYNKVPMKDRSGSVRNYRVTLCHKTATAPSIQAWFISGRPRPLSILLWRHPGLRHGAVDDVPLNSLAVWAGKRSQILAPHARLNRRQPHGRTASGALRTLVLLIEHVLLLNPALSSAS